MKRKVTERNAATIMGFINNFFRKDMKVFEGMKQIPIGHEQITYSNDTFTVPVWSELIPYYRPMIHPSCKWHYCYKDKDYQHMISRNFPKVLLAISTPYESSCFPIYEGNFIEIKGTTLLLYSNRSPFSGDQTRIYKFIHEEITESEHDSHIAYSVSSMFADDIFNEEYEWCGYDEYWGSNLKEIVSYTREKIDGLIKLLMTKEKGKRAGTLNIDFKSLCDEPECNNGSVYIDMDEVSINGLSDKCFTFYIEGEKATVQTLNHFAIYVYHPLIAKYNEEHENDLDEDDNDFDPSDWD